MIEKVLSLVLLSLMIVGMALMGYVVFGLDVANGTSKFMNVGLALVGLIMMCSGVLGSIVSALMYEDLFQF